MLISVTVRCLNEKELLPIFIRNHQFADEIIICDGGSTDGSRELVRGASALGDTEVRLEDFSEKVQGISGGWRNPEGRHVNFAIDQCRGEWIWLTEMDAIPTNQLQGEVRGIIKGGCLPAIGTVLYYLAPRKMGHPYEHYPVLIAGHGLTCWHRSLNVRAVEEYDFTPHVPFEKPMELLESPLARVHLSWVSEEVVQRKIKFYKEVHDLSSYDHPDKLWGERVLLPDNVRWKGM